MKPANNNISARPSEKSETWSEHAYILLKKDILSGLLAPGSKLKIEQLKEKYNVGPTPLREALSRLSSEGLVQIEQLKGFRVAPMSREELKELCELRVIIESEALRRAIAKGDENWEGQIAGSFYKLDRLERRLGLGEAIDPDEWEERNREFHDALVAAAGSQWLLRLRNQLFDHFERYRRQGRLALPNTPSRDVRAEHQDMMEAALARDGDEAARIMAEHILGVPGLLGVRIDD